MKIVEERKKAEDELAERARQSALGAEVGNTLVQDKDLRGLLQLCTESMVRHLDAAFARIWTLNEKDNVLELQASAGMYTHIDGPHGRVPVGRFKIGLVALEKKPHLTNELIGDPRIGDPEWTKREGLVAFAGHPLVVADKLVGVMALFSKKPLKETTLTALSSIADEIALGIERKKVEETLKEQKIFAESLIENSAVATFVLNPRHEVVFWNKACEELTGVAGPDMLGTKNQWKPFYAQERQVLADIIIDSKLEDMTVLYTAYEQSVLLKNGLHSEGWYPNLNGRERYIIFDAAPVYDTRGELSVVIETLQDITELKRTDEALQQSEKKYKDLFDSSLDGIYQIDADGVFILMNPAGARMFGYERPDEIIGRKGLEYWRDPRDRDAFRAELKIKKSMSGYHMRLKKKNGEPLELETSSTIKEDDKGAFLGMEGILRDVTEHKHLEAQLRHAQKMEAVGLLAGGIAHDFNNILNVIMGYGNLLMDRIGDDEISRDHMHEVLSAAEKAANLTSRLLVFSRKQVIDIKPTDINELIADIRKMLARIIRENIEFTLDLSGSRLIVMADAGQIEQVLMNLVANARDAMPEGGRLKIATRHEELDAEYLAAYEYGEPGQYALITVSDTGNGIDTETQKKIFEPFFTTKGIGEGTGLGLAISYGIVKQHKGYIKVYSELGKGTEFKVYLPLLEETGESDMTEDAVPAMGGDETILVAEDDAAVRKLTRIVLESFGYTVITAEDGEEAIRKFMENREKIRLVLLDMIMPKKNGKEVGELIRRVSPRTKIVFASGYTMDIIKPGELAEASFDFILKPISPKDLLKIVRELLDK